MMSEQRIHREIPIESSKEPGSFRLISTLGVAGFVAGVVLVGVYMLTLPIIQRNKELALQEAIYQVLPGCRSFETLVFNDGQLTQERGAANNSQARIFLGFDSTGHVIGFAIPASSSGFQDLIKLIYGFEARDRLVIGFQVLESKETPGLGDKIYKDDDFVANFQALQVEPDIEATPSGNKTKPNQVETITGATISSKAVIRALQISLNEYKPAMIKYLERRGTELR